MKKYKLTDNRYYLPLYDCGAHARRAAAEAREQVRIRRSIAIQPRIHCSAANIPRAAIEAARDGRTPREGRTPTCTAEVANHSNAQTAERADAERRS